MVEARGGLDLAEEARRTRGGCDLGMQHLHRDRAHVLLVLGAEHGRSAALSQLPLDSVAACERPPETIQVYGQLPSASP